MKKHIRYACGVPALLCLLAVGCGGTLRPETEIAAVATGFQASEKEFIRARTQAVKNRQSNLNALETGAAQTRQDAELRISVWRVAGDKDKARLYDEVLAASKASSARAEALAKLDEEHALALSRAGTKMLLDQAKLANTIKLLGNLGAGLSIEEWAGFFLGFAKQTQAELDKAAKDTSKQTQAEVDEAAKDTKASVPGARPR